MHTTAPIRQTNTLTLWDPQRQHIKNKYYKQILWPDLRRDVGCDSCDCVSSNTSCIHLLELPTDSLDSCSAEICSGLRQDVGDRRYDKSPDSRELILSTLRSHVLFTPLTESQVETIIGQMHKVDVVKGETVIQQGEYSVFGETRSFAFLEFCAKHLSQGWEINRSHIFFELWCASPNDDH